jgi:hypothetical protein
MQKAQILTVFTSSDRDQLRCLGLTAEQIGKLESILPVCKSVLDVHADAAPLNDVRAEFDRIAENLRATQKTLTALIDARQSRPADKEVWLRIVAELYRTHREYQVTEKIDAAMQALQVVLEAVDAARDKVPHAQRRHHTASSEPIEIIHKALLLAGCVLKPSRTTDSVFFRVVDICYCAIRPNLETSPERAIKAYMSERAKQALVRHSGYEQDARKIRPGRKVPKKG